MSAASPDSLPVAARRRSRRLAYWNGALWATGNGLASTQLVIYLALELHAPGLGLGIGLILAAPNLVGVLRMAAPALVGKLGDRKWFCEGSFFASAMFLAALPVLAVPGRLASPEASLAALVVLWCIYHLLQYLGSVALWSWLADLVPLRIRGRFIGRRERWMVLGQAGGMLAAGLHAWGWHALHPDLPEWMAYVPPVVLGVGFMLAAVIPLMRMPQCTTAGPSSSEGDETNRVAWPRLRGHVGISKKRAHASESMPPGLAPFLAPFRDWRFRRLLLFGCWFSFFNGITQSAMNVYAARVLLFHVLVMLTLRTAMRLGQWGLSPTAGRLADRVGNRPVLLVSLLLVAQGPLFYLLAVPEHRWWIAGAWLVWIAWAGLNVALPNLMLKLSPGASNLPYIATYYTIAGLCYAASTIAGGFFYDRLRLAVIELPGGVAWDGFTYLFFVGWIMRMLGAVVLLLVVEPKRGR